MIRRTFLFGSITNSERTVRVLSALGWIMSYSLATLLSWSAMIGKLTLQPWVSLMSLIHSLWESTGSSLRAIALTLRLPNSPFSLAVGASSVVQIGGKSAG